MGLTKPGQKELPSKYLYDTLGSKLFEVISELPEYGLTRADERLVRTHAQEIVQRVPGDVVLCELGSGSGKKTRWILQAFPGAGTLITSRSKFLRRPWRYADASLSDIDSISIVGLEREYLDGLLEVVARRAEGQRVLVLFLGSTIGNFGRPAD